MTSLFCSSCKHSSLSCWITLSWFSCCTRKPLIFSLYSKIKRSTVSFTITADPEASCSVDRSRFSLDCLSFSSHWAFNLEKKVFPPWQSIKPSLRKASFFVAIDWPSNKLLRPNETVRQTLPTTPTRPLPR